MYTIKQDGTKISQNIAFAQAIEFAEKTFRSLHENTQKGINTCKKSNTRNTRNTQTTLSVEDKEGKIIASLSNYQIIGAFTKEKWEVDSKRLIVLDTVDFDATNHVLLLRHEDIIELEDGTAGTDAIGTAHVAWSGPHDVSVTSAICAYFGVNDVTEIERENLLYVQDRIKPQAEMEVEVELSVKLKLRVGPDADAAFLNTLDWTLIQNTAGAVIRSAEVTRM